MDPGIAPRSHAVRTFLPVRSHSPAFHAAQSATSLLHSRRGSAMAGYIYILGSHTGTLYIGVTSNLFVHVQQHKSGKYPGFSKSHGCQRLLYYEHFEDISRAIAREKQLKRWIRSKKIQLIARTNPSFRDLSEKWGWTMISPAESIRDHAPQNTDPITDS
jgi:putative endonuclease